MTDTEVAIIGGGPVGLFLGCLLAQRGIRFTVREKRQTPAIHSRAIGIHLPALEVLATVGVRDELIASGIRVTGGQVFYGPKSVGRLDLAPAFVLAIPQTVTEAVLECQLNELAPGALSRGVALEGALPEAQYVIGCDGKNSTVRTLAGIAFHGGPYPDTYLMGDFADNTPFGSDAALFPSRGGIVESFPLPGQLRRWVARMPEGKPPPEPERLAEVIAERTGHHIPIATCTWISAFGIEHYLAKSLVKGNVLLAGDAAHIVSPIGGQGMNLGLLDAFDLAECLHAVLRHGANPAVTFGNYNRRRQRAARRILQRAAFNTHLGRPCPPYDVRRLAVWSIVNVSPLSRRFARVFTMRA